MSPLQTYSNHYSNHWVIIDESSSIASPNRSSRPQPPLPIIKVPFPPNVNPEELILKPRKAKSKLPTKPPNAFMIYRMQYVKELHARDYRLPMRSVSASVAAAWRDEPDHIVEYYEEIAREASKIYNQKYPKPPVQPRSTVGNNKQQQQQQQQLQQTQRRRSELANLTSPTTVPFYDIEDIRQQHHHYNNNNNNNNNNYYSEHNRPLPHSFSNGSHNYHNNHHIHSPTTTTIPSLIAEQQQHYPGILGRPQVRSIKSLSAPYPSTTSILSPIHMQLPHVNSLINTPLQHYMDDSPNDWGFTNSTHH